MRAIRILFSLFLWNFWWQEKGYICYILEGKVKHGNWEDRRHQGNASWLLSAFELPGELVKCSLWFSRQGGVGLLRSSQRVPVPKGHTVCELERCLQTSWVPWDLKVPSQASPIRSLPKGWSHIGPGVHTLISWSLFANLYQQPSTSCMCMCCRKLDTSSLTFLRLLCTLYMSLWVGTDNRL